MFESVYKKRQKRGYAYKLYAVEDYTATSPDYFNIVEFPTTLTAGKNVVKLGLDGPKLRADTYVDMEVLDSEGNPLYVEYTNYKDRFGYHYFIIYVYDLQPVGVGSIDIVGIALYDQSGNSITMPSSEHVFEHNVRWRTSVDIKPTERNITDIHFQKGPKVTVSQVLVPYKFNVGTYNINTKLVTSSLTDLRIVNTENVGFDVKMNTSDDIQDIEDLRNTYNYFQKSSTANIVQTNIRKYHKDVIDGYVYSEYFRYGTMLQYARGGKANLINPFTKDMEGSTLSLSDLDNGESMRTTWTYQPESGSLFEILGGTGSLQEQYSKYKPKIISVVNRDLAILSHPPSLKVIDKINPNRTLERALNLSALYNVTASFAYPESTQEEIQSISFSSSYIQFTLTDFKPIVGDVYRIKAYVKEAGQNTEYYLLNDHIVKSPEYLIDTDKTNQAVYMKNQSDFFLYGEFTSPDVAADYWRGFYIKNKRLEQYSFNRSGSTIVTTNYPLANSIKVVNTGSFERGFFSRYYQTYLPGEPYSLSFYCTLDPGCELEVYMNSTPLKPTQLGFPAPKAFKRSPDYDASGSGYTELGRLVGKVSNINGASTKFYDNVVFDFYADDDGFGRPLFRLKSNTTSSRSAYVSSICITPLDLVGYTPSILQFTAATPDSLHILQDDEAHLSQSIDVKLEYYTSDGKQSEYVTYIPNLVLNMLNETPGFCASEVSKFDIQCPIYYEIGQNDPSHDSVKPNSGTSSLDPTLWDAPTYFWPTFSFNNYGGYSWNMWSFRIAGSDYVNDFEWVQPSTASAFWMPSASAIVTSSWYRYDPMLPLYNSPSFPLINPAAPLAYMYSYANVGGQDLFTAAPTDELPTNEYSRPFYLADGVALDKWELAQAHVDNLDLSSNNCDDIQLVQQDLEKLNYYLKTSRLFYPITSGGFEYGFFENGGVYNVKFKITTAPDFGINYPDNGTPYLLFNDITSINKTADRTKYAPDKGAKLMVYIADVASNLPQDKRIVPGVEGFFPPNNNIVTIGNFYGITPEMVFFDSGSGYRTDVYDLVLVQYGEKAQLVFDGCGLDVELDTNPLAEPGSYKITNNPLNALWGGIISDIEWCKIGVTTDPRYIKPVNFDAEVRYYAQKRGPKRSIFVDPSFPIDTTAYFAIVSSGEGYKNNWTVVRPYYQQAQKLTLAPSTNITSELTQIPPTQPTDLDEQTAIE